MKTAGLVVVSTTAAHFSSALFGVQTPPPRNDRGPRIYGALIRLSRAIERGYLIKIGRRHRGHPFNREPHPPHNLVTALFSPQSRVAYIDRESRTAGEIGVNRPALDLRSRPFTWGFRGRAFRLDRLPGGVILCQSWLRTRLRNRCRFHGPASASACRASVVCRCGIPAKRRGAEAIRARSPSITSIPTKTRPSPSR